MCKKILLSAVLLSFLILSLPANVAAQSDGTEALLDSLSLKYDWNQYRIATETWQLLTGNRPDSLPFFEDLFRHTFSDRIVYKQLQSANAAGLSAENRRKLSFFTHLFQIQKVEASPVLRQLRDSILIGLGRADYVLDGTPTDSGRLNFLLRASSDRTVREKAYRALTVGSKERADQIATLMRLRNQEAKKDGYNTYAALSFSNDAVMLDDYGRILAEIDKQTKAAYDELLARLKPQIVGGQTEIWDLPALVGAGANRQDDLFPVDTLFPSMLAALRATGFDFDKLPIYYNWTDSTEPNPVTSAIVRSPLDQRLTGYLKPGYGELRRLLGQTGLTLYGAYIRQDDPLFNRPLDGPMVYAISCLFELLPDKSRWLQNVYGMPGAQADALARAASDLHLLTIRLLLTEASFELEVYRNPTAKINDLYWATFERIMGLPKHTDLFPPSVNSSLVLKPFEAGERLLGWAIAAQTWDYLKNFSGSVVSSRDTRAFLVQNYFRFGTRFEWPELLERGTGGSLDPTHLQVLIEQ